MLRPEITPPKYEGKITNPPIRVCVCMIITAAPAALTLKREAKMKSRKEEKGITTRSPELGSS
jgi:hypothetical protein